MSLLQLVLLVFLVSYSSGEYQDNIITNEEPDPYKPYVWKVLDVLKANTGRNFNYNYGKIIEFTKKDENVYDITFDVKATCLLATESCLSKVLQCSGSVKYLPDTNELEASSDASCEDVKKEIVVTEPTTTEEIVTEKVIKQTAPCLGCAVELDTNIAGIEPLLDSALFHVESERQQKHVILKILKVTRQIVAGVKYTLLLQIAPTTCSLYTFTSLTECPVDRNIEPEICEISYYQRPWLSREKRITSNNCTQSQQFVTKSVQSFDPERYDYAEKDNVGQQREMTEDRWSSLLSQIIPDSKDDEQKKVDESHFTVEDKTEVNNNSEQSQNIKFVENDQKGEENSYTNISEIESEQQVDSTSDLPSEIIRKRRNADSSSSSSSSSDDDDNNNDNNNNHDDDNNVEKHDKRKHKKASEKNDKVKKNDDKNNDDTSSSSSSDDDNNGNNRNRRDVELSLIEKSIETLNYGAYKHSLKKIIKTKELDLEIPFYFVVTVVTMSKCDDETCKPVEEKICKLKLKQDELIKIICHSTKKLQSKNSTRFTRGVPGAPVDARNDEKLNTLLKATALQLDTESNHANKYKLRIIEATRQVVSGILYKIRAWLVLTDCSKNDTKDSEECGDLDEPKHEECDITIWNQPWLKNGRKTNVTCGETNHHFLAKRDLENIDVEKDFKQFMKRYKKKYTTTDEYYYRMEVFASNLEKIHDLNAYELGTAVYGITKFADLDEEEFKMYKGLRMDLRNENDLGFIEADIPNIDPPVEFDWRTKNVVTKVKDQGQCGSCWAFSVTGNVEGQYALKNGNLLEFSEQELVDCDKLDEGCNGGLMDNAYRAIEKMGGLETEGDYPYDAEDEQCHFNKSMARVQLRGAVNISQDETEMAQWLVKNGPISIAINANAMQFYMGGISHPLKFLCDPKNLDHGVLIVGYGVHKYPVFKKTLPYWIVKNSWGPSWGEQGYYRVYRGDGTCGVNQTPSSALL